MTSSGRVSLAATYDLLLTGPRFSVETRVAGRLVSVTPMVDPFMVHRVTVGWRDLLRGLLRRRLEIVVSIDAPPDLVEDVLELNADYLGVQGSSRRVQWERSLNRALAREAEREF